MNKKVYTSLYLNITIFVLVTFSMIMMIFGVKFTEDDILSGIGLSAFKYFTVDSNFLMGIIALVFALYDILVLKEKINTIPNIVYIFKFIITVSVMTTFLTVVLYLAPTAQYDAKILFTNSNLFFHLIIPLLSLITFLFFENQNKLTFKTTFLCLLPLIIYGIYYAPYSLSHLENGTVPLEYDWYGFARNGVLSSVIIFLINMFVTYLTSYLIWLIRKKLK